MSSVTRGPREGLGNPAAARAAVQGDGGRRVGALGHPLLTKVLADALRSVGHEGGEPSECHCIDVATEYVAAIPAASAERLEEALSTCGFHNCYLSKDDPYHQQPDSKVGARLSRHMFVPLVQP